MVPVIILLAMVVRGLTADADVGGAVTVTDAYTGAALPNTAIVVNGQTLLTDDLGQVRLPARDRALPVDVARDGYAPIAAALPTADDGARAISLRPTTLRGTITDAATGQPIPNVAVSLIAEGSTGQTVASGVDGSFLLADVPPDARVHLDGGDYGVVDEPVGPRTDVAYQMKRSVVTGVVRDASGTPIQGAIVTAGGANTVSGVDGSYRLTGVPDGAEVLVAASGYSDLRLPLTPERVLDAALEPVLIKGIYANGFALATPEEIDRLIDLIDRTELNALVVDIKQDTIYYDSQVALFRDAGMVQPVYDAAELLTRLKERDIYVIARMVVFQDPVLAEARPDLAVKDPSTGGIWRNDDGIGWVNAFEEELWRGNIELAVEAAGLGFDEIQYDYVRFPSDGNLAAADFGQEYTGEARENAILEFLTRSHDALAPTGVKLAADIFGYTAFEDNEQGIGQNFAKIVPVIDYVNMMIYPSHFIEGNIRSAPGHPNDYPYETILESLQRSESVAPGQKLKFRPWLQAFSYPVEGMREYGPEDVRAQIEAAEEFGASGWLLWNPANEYDDGSLLPA